MIILRQKNIEEGNRKSADQAHQAAMENVTRINTPRTNFRVQRLIAVQEVLLEYSLAIVMLGCFILLNLSPKILREVRVSEDELYFFWV